MHKETEIIEEKKFEVGQLAFFWVLSSGDYEQSSQSMKLTGKRTIVHANDIWRKL